MDLHRDQSWTGRIGIAVAVIGMASLPKASAQYPMAPTAGYGAQAGAGSRSNAAVQNMLPWMIMSGPVGTGYPYGAPNSSVYNAYGLTPQQMGLYMLTMPGRTGGFGSGQLSGVRPGPMTPGVRPRQVGLGRDPESEPEESLGPRMSNRPGGQANRFFSRPAATSQGTPRRYYGRANRYFP
jgi:hypothetical protein